MKFLTKEDWERILNKLGFNKNNMKETAVEKVFYEISQRMKRITIKNALDHTTYGIGMTLFHYYICFNDIRNIDKVEICYACLYMSLKIQFVKDAHRIIEDYIQSNKERQVNEKPDLIKYEILLYSQLGYDLDIETPFHFFYSMVPYIIQIFPSINTMVKLDKLKHFCFNLLSDTYTRPLSIYYHPKIIFLSALLYTIRFLDFTDCDINKLIKNENLDLISECMEKIYQIFSRYIEDNTNTNKNVNTNKDNKNNNDNNNTEINNINKNI